MVNRRFDAPILPLNLPAGRNCLRSWKIPFKIVPSRYPGSVGAVKTAPEVLCVRHAVGKAQKAVLPKAARFVLAGDTIVWHRAHGLAENRTATKLCAMLRVCRPEGMPFTPAGDWTAKRETC